MNRSIVLLIVLTSLPLRSCDATRQSRVRSVHRRSLGSKSSKTSSNMVDEVTSSKSSKQHKSEKVDEEVPNIFEFDHHTMEQNENIVVDDYVTKLSSKSAKKNKFDNNASKSSKNGVVPVPLEETAIDTGVKSSKSAKVKTSKSSKTSDTDSPSLFESEDETQVISSMPTQLEVSDSNEDSPSLFDSNDEPNQANSPTHMPSVAAVTAGIPSTDIQAELPVESSSPTAFLDGLSTDSSNPTISHASTNSSLTIIGNSPTISRNTTEPDDLEYIDTPRVSDEDITGALRYSTKAVTDERNTILAYGLASLSVLLVLATVGLIATRRRQLIDEMMKKKSIESGTPQSSFEEAA